MSVLGRLQRLQNRARELSRVEVRIRAKGTYPNASRTPVAKVAKYQNDGTARIAPSHFVERAAAQAGGWRAMIHAAVTAFIFRNASNFRPLGQVIASDISAMCDRVKTGQLKASFRPEIKQ